MYPTIPVLHALTIHVLAAIALVALMVELGLELEPVTDRAAKRHTHRQIARAIVFNFAGVPLLALLVLRGLGATGAIATALLLLAASPGGRHAPALVRAGRGDVGLAVEITLFLNKLNSILSPLLVAWMIGVSRIGLHELTYLAELMLLQILPYYGARGLRKRRPELARRLVRPMSWTVAGSALVLLGYLMGHQALRLTFLFGVRGWLAVLLFGLVLWALGWLIGGRDVAEKRAFAVTTESRNLALALVMASLAVRDEQVMLAIFSAWLILFALGWVAVGLARTYRPAPSPALQT